MPKRIYWCVWLRTENGKLKQIAVAVENWFLQSWTARFLEKEQAFDFALDLARQYGIPVRLIHEDGTSTFHS